MKKDVVKVIQHEEYKETLLRGKETTHGMSILRSDKHEIFGMQIQKISLSAFDSKRWLEEDGINTKPFDYISTTD